MTVSTRQGEFLSIYQIALDNYVELYKTLEDPPDPITVFFTRNFDYERMEEMGTGWAQEVQEIKRCNSAWRDTLVWINSANNAAKVVMSEHFKTAGYDYKFPPAPDIDLETPKRLKNYEQKLTCRGEEMTKLHKIAIQIGQLVVLSESQRGEKTWTVIVDSTGLSFPFRLSCDGDKERKAIYHACVLLLATEWSKLTNWSTFEMMPAKVRRALGEKAKTIYSEYMEV